MVPNEGANIFLEAAKNLRALGLNPVPCNKGKSPVGTWSEYQNSTMPETIFKKRLNGHAYGIGILCGIGSGNLEVIDIDHKYDLTGNLVNDYFGILNDTNPELFNRLLIHKTGTHGFHIYYRCASIQGNQKLARRYATDEELAQKPEEKTKVLIETRGLGGFIVAPPTPGYSVWQENPIPTISAEERDFLLTAGRSFEEVHEIVQQKKEKEFDHDRSPFELTPWDDYNDRGDIIEVLERHGWTVDSKYRRPDRVYLIRPGKSKGHSADYLKSHGLFKCWSTSDSSFVTEKAYNKTAVFTILECNGDFSAASKKLEEMGYGLRKSKVGSSKLRAQDSAAEQQHLGASGNTTSPQTIEETPKKLSDYDHLLITREKEISKEDPVVTICGASFAAPHNISMISAAPKGAKTAINNVMASCSISADGSADGFPDIKAKANIDRRAVILFDTEQSAADQQYNVNTIVRRAGLDETPDFLRCYNIRQLDFRGYKDITDAICKLCAESFNGIHSIYIDGGADYIASVNDEEQSTEIIQWFTHLAIKYNCPVIIVVHQNPGGDKERGHFGSTGQRKCYGLISIVKEGDVFTLQPKMMRRAGNSDVPLIQFSYSVAKGYHVQVDAPDRELEKAIKEREKLKEIAVKVFSPSQSYRHKDAISRIMDVTNRKLTTAKKMLEDMCGFQYVEQGEDYNYRINLKKVGKVKEGQNDLNDLLGQEGQNGSNR